MGQRRVLVLIPARYASSRFPGKPLALIHGVSMIERVFRSISESLNSEMSSTLHMEAFVVTDDSRIKEHVLGFGGQVVMVDDDVVSGTERIHLAYERFFKDKNFDLVINVQGDEPLLKRDLLIGLVEDHLQSSYDIMTVVKSSTDWHEFSDPNNVKAIFVRDKKSCLYFSRAPIPFDRDGEGHDEWFLHIGIYSFRPDALVKMSSHPTTTYEKLEKLEQLRALELGLCIGAIETDMPLMGVDLPEDIVKLEGVLSGEEK